MSAEPVTILLVEDDDIDVETVRRALGELKIANPLRVARDGVEGLEILRGENGHEPISKPYIILLDLNMPRMNGLEFLGALRNDPDLSCAVVFVLTTSSEDRDRTAAYEKHVAGYILKSAAGESFLEAIKMLDHYWHVVLLPENSQGS